MLLHKTQKWGEREDDGRYSVLNHVKKHWIFSMFTDYRFDLCFCHLEKTILVFFMETYRISYLWINWYAKCHKQYPVFDSSFHQYNNLRTLGGIASWDSVSFHHSAAKRPEITRNGLIAHTNRFTYANLNWHKPTPLLKDLPSFIPTQAVQSSQQKPKRWTDLILITSLNLLGVRLSNACVGRWKEVPQGHGRVSITPEFLLWLLRQQRALHSHHRGCPWRSSCKGALVPPWILAKLQFAACSEEKWTLPALNLQGQEGLLYWNNSVSQTQISGLHAAATEHIFYCLCYARGQTQWDNPLLWP